MPQLTPVNALQVIEQGRRQTRKRLPTRAAVEEKEERLGEMQRLVHAADTRRRYRVWSVMHTIANPVPVRIRNKAEHGISLKMDLCAVDRTRRRRSGLALLLWRYVRLQPR